MIDTAMIAVQAKPSAMIFWRIALKTKIRVVSWEVLISSSKVAFGDRDVHIYIVGANQEVFHHVLQRDRFTSVVIVKQRTQL
jgi:hypothetical protein